MVYCVYNHSQEIDTNDWIIKPIDKERGGMNFVTPNVEGKYILDGKIYIK